jgi:hypothetical protein
LLARIVSRRTRSAISASDTRIVHQLTSGIAGWLTYEQMRKGVDNLLEHSLYAPVENIANGRKLEVLGQFKIPRHDDSSGAPKTIDFLIVNRKNKYVVALEIKFKNLNKKLTGSLTKDVDKLNFINISMINNQIKEPQDPPNYYDSR